MERVERWCSCTLCGTHRQEVEAAISSFTDLGPPQTRFTRSRVRPKRASGHRGADGEGASDPLLVEGNGAIRQVQSVMTARSGGETGRSNAITASPQGYSSRGSQPAGPRSGQCRIEKQEGRPREGAIMSEGQWAWARQRGQPEPPESEKTAITAACWRFIADVLKPRCLPRIEPTSFNYPVDIYGKWHGNKYRFVQRFRSDRPDAIAPEFDAPFARLDNVGRDRFDLYLIFGTRVSGTVSINPFRSPKR